MNQSAGAVCIIMYIVSSSTIRENTILKLFNSVRYSQPPNGQLRCGVTRKWLSLQSDNRVKKLGIRNYSTQEDTTNVIGRESNTADIKPVKYYEDIYTMKSQILKENKNKSGIYKFVNKLSGSFYIGSAKNLRTLIYSYLQLSSLLKGKNNSIITRALIKYGYSNFSLEILEYCDVSKLLEREQYYFDLLEPDYKTSYGYSLACCEHP